MFLFSVQNPSFSILHSDSRVPCRNLDMVMLACFNSSERTAADWEKLFTTADQRFEFLGVRQLEQSTMAVVEVQWAGQ